MTVKRSGSERQGTARLNLTKKGIAALHPPDAKRTILYDTRTRGLGVMVQPTGHRSFFWFRKVRGYPTWQTIGAFPDLTVEQARARAAELNAHLARWKADRYEGDDPFKQRRDLTLGELAADYLERQVRPHAARPERAVKDAEGTMRAYLAAWQSRRLGTIRRADVLNLHAQLGRDNGRVTANRVVQFLRTLYNWAGKAEVWRGENPARTVKFFHEEQRTRFLQPEELARLFTALRSEPHADLRDLVLLSLLTGARKSDIFSMRWENLYLDDNRWQVPKPKNRKPYQVALMPEAVDLLRKRLGRRRDDNPWVFPSHGKTGHLVNVKKPWQRLRKRAAITDVWQHDLRRTLGSWQAAQGTSLKIIGESLGHRSLAATQVYARLNLDPVRASVTAATQAMLAAGKKRPKLLKGPGRA
jgi:integrase